MNRAATAACPKAMTHGPCGGVAPDGACEVPGHRCPFVDVVRWRGVPANRAPFAVRFLVDLRLRRRELDRLPAAVEPLRDVADAVLLGEHLDDDTGFSPSEAARWVADHVGVPAVVTVTGRDRRPAQLPAVMTSLAEAGALAVHCVTGDHPSARFGATVRATFGAESFDLIRSATETGLAATAAAAPASPPVGQRARRAADKATAGAVALVANHVADDAVLGAFAAELTRLCDAALLAPVALLTDPESVARLAQFPGLHLPPADVEAVVAARSPTEGRARGLAVAVDRCRRLLAAPGVSGINLSGTGPADPADRAEFVAQVIQEVR